MKNHFVLFDLDGTITDSSEGIVNSILYALDKMGVKEEDSDRLRSYVGPSLKETFRNNYFSNDKDCQQAIMNYREYYSEKGIFENKLYTDVLKVLKTIKDKGGVVALATAKPGYFAKIILNHFGINYYFDSIVGSHLRGTRTDKRDIIFEVLDQFGFPDSNHIYMVGDRKYDILGGKYHGLKTIGVEYGYANHGELLKVNPDFIIQSPLQILECF
ncbi:MAG: phosphoglycolate phosphatase [Flavobacteriales bacterium]|nr:phosphoglycolate phosphatase [Flavobacteriales bacterium]|tara:strand:+ start:1601 stop:2245 length:645 start_codon:yes stop_codon:yes gene_type:complete